MKPIASRWCQGLFFSVVLAAVVGCLGCGSGGSNGNGDPALVGTWSGTMVGGDATVWTFTFTSTTGDVKKAGNEAYLGNYTVDTSTDPKQITFSITASPTTVYVGETSNAIYKIEGSTLTFAGNEPGNTARPTSFTPGNGTVVFDLTKQ